MSSSARWEERISGPIRWVVHWTSQTCMILRLLLRYELDMNDNSHLQTLCKILQYLRTGSLSFASSPPCKIPPPSTTPTYTHVDLEQRSSSQTSIVQTHIRSHSSQSYSQIHHFPTHSSSSRCTLPPTIPFQSSYNLFRNHNHTLTKIQCEDASP
jgi:hypothetical protein